jgi:hypothetical protein
MRIERGFGFDHAVEKTRLTRWPADRLGFVPCAYCGNGDPRILAKLGDCRFESCLPLSLIRPETDQANGHGDFTSR